MRSAVRPSGTLINVACVIAWLLGFAFGYVRAAARDPRNFCLALLCVLLLLLGHCL